LCSPATDLCADFDTLNAALLITLLLLLPSVFAPAVLLFVAVAGVLGGIGEWCACCVVPCARASKRFAAEVAADAEVAVWARLEAFEAAAGGGGGGGGDNRPPLLRPDSLQQPLILIDRLACGSEADGLP
jgi:hypothetical protein